MTTRSLRRPVRAALLLAAAIAAALASAAPAAAFTGRNGAIVYGWSNFVEEEGEPPSTVLDEAAIRSIPPGGGDPTTLRGCTRAVGEPPAGDCAIGYRDPAVSANGRLVAFDAGASIALMRIDGAGFRLLPALSDDDGDPAFSPGGGRLALSAGASTAIFDRTPARGIRVRDLDGGHSRQVTRRGISPAWSSRNWIAFVRANGVYRARPDGRGLRRLVARTLCSDVAWSPRGTRLAFTCRDRLYVSRGDGSRLRRVRGMGGTAVAWSPDGRLLAVGLFDGPLVTIRPDGTHQRQLVPGGAGALYRFGAAGVDWQPR